MHQKGEQSGRGSVLFPCADGVLPALRRGLRPSGMVHVWNVVSPTAPNAATCSTQDHDKSACYERQYITIAS